MAIVMPEIGFDELPISPVMRDDTVTKKKPKSTTRTADEDVALRRRAGADDEEDCQQQRTDEDDDERHVALRSRARFATARRPEVLHAFAERRHDRRDACERA